MNLRQLEVFHAIMTFGTVSEAARSLNVAQPSVSTVLKHAEQNLGVKLFQRIGGRLTPTPEAEKLFPEVARVYDQLALLNRFTRDLSTGGSGHLMLIGNPTLTNTLMPAAISIFRKEQPQVRIRLQTAISAAQIADGVVRRQWDLGLFYGPNPDVHTGTETVGWSDIAVAMHEDHPLAACSEISARQLAGQDVITFGAGSPIRNAAERIFRDAGVELSPVIEASFSATACVLARDGSGVAIIDPRILGAERYDRLAIRPFTPRQRIELQAVTAKNRPLSRQCQRFLAILKELLAEETA